MIKRWACTKFAPRTSPLGAREGCRKGVWQRATEVPGTSVLNAGGGAEINSVSCASPGNCAAGGGYQDSSRRSQALVADEFGS